MFKATTQNENGNNTRNYTKFEDARQFIECQMVDAAWDGMENPSNPERYIWTATDRDGRFGKIEN